MLHRTMLHRTGSTLVLSVLLAVAAPAVAATPPAALPPAEAALQRLVDGARQSHSDTLLVTRGGREIARLGNVDAPIELMSATKSVVALGIGQLVGDGRIESLDQPVSDFYPEWKQGRKRDITVRMLLDHTSGLQNVPRAPVEIYPAPDVVQLALAAELDSAPGEAFSYNNKAVNLLSGIVVKASGQPMDEFFRDGLFATLGITPGPWEKDAAGNPHAMSGLPLSARDAAKIGQLVLDRGRVGGQQPVPAAFIDAMLAPGARTGEAGLLWWRRVAWERLTPQSGRLRNPARPRRARRAGRSAAGSGGRTLVRQRRGHGRGARRRPGRGSRRRT
jgi:CubicO group peptidase (beta-lactamase class C family)